MDSLALFLLENSHLPGPRANLALADEFARTASRDVIAEFANRPEEFLRFCGTQALGRVLADAPTDATVAVLLRQRAADPLWRVRESAARALQIVGDRNRQQLCAIATEWARDPDPYAQRAALAAICEPRLLDTEQTRRAARQACDQTTTWIRELPPSERMRPEVRTLRQALGYCWSVAIAADPSAGLRAFDPHRGESDRDVRWIVESNLKKARMRRLIDAG